MRSPEASRPEMATRNTEPLTSRTLTPQEEEREAFLRGKVQIVSPAIQPQRQELLDTGSQLLTNQEPFTAADLFAFADTMEKAAGSVHLGDGETLTVVPDIVPQTGVAQISIHQKVEKDGASINVVFQGTEGNPDKRYVYGENFSLGSNHNTRGTALRNGSTERDIPHAYSRRMDVKGTPLDTENAREIFTEVFVRHLANAGRISPDTAAEAIQEGTPVEALVGSK